MRNNLYKELKPILYRKKMSLKEACAILNITYSTDIDIWPLVECDHCSIYHLDKELHEDDGGMLICKTCEGWYGN